MAGALPPTDPGFLTQGKNIALSGVSSLGFFNVRDYGAKGDGSDDTAAFRQAVAAAEVVGGVVFVPTGTYRITSIEIKSASIWGSNASKAPFNVVTNPQKGCNIWQIAGTTDDLITYTGVLQKPSIQNITLIGCCNQNYRKGATTCTVLSTINRRFYKVNTSGIPNYAGVTIGSPNFYGWVSIFETTFNTFIGTALIGSIVDNGDGTSTIGIIDQWDNFCSRSGSGGLITLGSGPVIICWPTPSNFIDPRTGSSLYLMDYASAGANGIKALGTSLHIRNVSIFQFNCGISTGPWCQALECSEVWTENNLFAGLANIPGFGSDFSLIRFFTQGIYQRDWGQNGSPYNYYNWASRYQLFGVFAIPTGTSITDLSIAACVVPFYCQSAGNWGASYILCIGQDRRRGGLDCIPQPSSTGNFLRRPQRFSGLSMGTGKPWKSRSYLSRQHPGTRSFRWNFDH
jgi:Pectate lyase superfamily protein